MVVRSEPQLRGTLSRLLRFPYSGVLVCFFSLASLFRPHSNFVSSEGQQLRYCGVGAKHEDVIINGEPDDLKVGNYFLKTIACTEVF